MTIAIASGVHLGLSKGQHRIVFRNPVGLQYYYVFYVDDGNTTGPLDTFLEYDFSSDGVNFSSGSNCIRFDSTTTAIGEVHAFDVKMWIVSTTLHVALVAIGWDDEAGAFQTKYVKGTVGPTASVVSWNTEQDIDAAIGDQLGTPHCIALARTDNDEIVVAFTEDDTLKGKDYRLTKLIGSDGSGAAPSWSGEITWDDPSGSSNNQDKGEVWFGLESFSSSYPDDFLIYARVPESTSASTYQAVTAVPDWAQGGAGFTNTTQASWETAPDIAVGSLVSGLIDDADKVFFVYYDWASGAPRLDYRVGATAGDDDLGIRRLITGAPSDALTISLDTGPATDLLYIFYHKTADSVDWNYKIITVPISSEFTVSYHKDIIALSSWSRQIENSLHIAGLFGTVVVYNEHPVYKALSTTLADLELPYTNFYLGPHDL